MWNVNILVFDNLIACINVEGGNYRGCHMTLGAPQQLTKTTNPTHQFHCHPNHLYTFDTTHLMSTYLSKCFFFLTILGNKLVLQFFQSFKHIKINNCKTYQFVPNMARPEVHWYVQLGCPIIWHQQNICFVFVFVFSSAVVIHTNWQKSYIICMGKKKNNLFVKTT